MRSAFPDWSRTWRQSGELELWTGDSDTALSFLETSHREAERGNPEAAVRLAWLLDRRGRLDDATALIDPVEQKARSEVDGGSESWSPRWTLAAVASVRDRPDDVIDWLTKAHEHGFNWVRQHRSDPQFAAYRDDPRYQALGDAMAREIADQRRKSQPIVVGLGLPLD